MGITDPYTQAQRDYVASIPDSELRQTLLHLVHLHNNCSVASQEMFETARKRREQVEKAVAELADFRDHGLRFDLRPTHNHPSTLASETFWHRYIADADSDIRQRAHLAIAALQSGG